MKIVNCMFSAQLGGLEQVFVDYSEALGARGHEVFNGVAPGADVAPVLAVFGQPCHAIGNLNQYDLVAMWRIRRLLARLRPDVVMAHGNRAIGLVKPAARGLAPFVAVNHSINVKRTVGADFVIAINEDMRQRLVAAGQPAERIAKVFNMVRPPADLPKPRRPAKPPTIGAMGRFVPKKGFETFIEAVAELKRSGRPFSAVLAGAGEREPSLRALAKARGLDDVLRFPGWVTDKAAFFKEIDVFCFTSVHDVCPVVLLEAFVYAKPVILTNCPGPREISSDGVDSLLFPVDDAAGLARRIESLLDDPAQSQSLAASAQRKILDHHTLERTGALIETILRGVVARAAVEHR